MRWWIALLATLWLAPATAQQPNFHIGNGFYDLCAAAKEGPTFISIGAAEAIAQRHPIYEAVEIKAGALGGAPPKPEEDTDTISFSHYIVARRDLNDQMVGEFARVLFSIRQSLLAEIPSDKTPCKSAYWRTVDPGARGVSNTLDIGTPSK